MQNETKKISKIVPFSFERVSADNSVLSAIDSLKNNKTEDGEPLHGIIFEDRMSDFEKAQFLKYKLRELESELNTKNEFDLKYNKSKMIRRVFEFDFDNCGLVYKGPKIKETEKQIDKLPFIHDYSNFGGQGIVMNWDMV